ncbi:MAG: hypothetical protein JRI46_00470 [Deltaproteobacteria bacterium]|nr:hypothetical protein [Deltaproteobacteria bacterium]
MKKLGIAVVIIVGVFVLLLVFKNMLIKMGVEKGAKKVTGLELAIGDMDVGLLASKVDITDMKLLNPAGFPDKVMINIAKFLVDFELASFFKGRAHFETVELNLKELIVVRNRERKLNISALKSVSEKTKKEKKPVKKKKEEKTPPEVTIDKLILTIGKVTYKDYSWGKTPFTKTFNIGVHEVFRNITDPKKLVNLIIVRALQGTGIAQLANFDLGTLRADVSDTLKKGVSGVTEAGQKELKELEKTTKEEAAEKVEEEVTKGLKEKFKFK